MPVSETVRHAFQVISDDKSFVVLCPSAAAKENWISDIEHARASAVIEAEEESDDNEHGAPVWIPDSATKGCMSCHATFTVVRRRHHCRYCGKVVCGNCTKDRIALPRASDPKKVRVCKTCFMDIKEIFARGVLDATDTGRDSESETGGESPAPRRLPPKGAPGVSSGSPSSPNPRNSPKTLRSWRSSTKYTNLDDVATKYRGESVPDPLDVYSSKRASPSPGRTTRERRSRTIGDSVDMTVDAQSAASVILLIRGYSLQHTKMKKFPSSLLVGKVRRSLLKTLAPETEFYMFLQKSSGDNIRMDDRKPLFVYQAIAENENELEVLLVASTDAASLDVRRGSLETTADASPTSSPALPRARPKSRRSARRKPLDDSSSVDRREQHASMRTQSGRTLTKHVRDAVRSGDIVRLKELVRLDKPDFAEAMGRQQREELQPSRRSRRWSCVPFLDAVGDSQKECLVYLLEYARRYPRVTASGNEIDLDWLNATDDHGGHVLHVCFERRSGDLVAEEMTALLLHCEKKQGVVSLPISSAFANSSGNTPLHYWARYCDWSSWRRVGAGLLAAAVYGDYNSAERSSAVRDLVNAKNAAGDTALHCCMMNAALSGRVQQRSDMASLLCQAGANPNAVNGDGYTPLHTLVLATATQLTRAEQLEPGRTARPWEKSLGGNIKVVSPEEITHIAAVLISAGANLSAQDGSPERLTPAELATQLIRSISEIPVSLSEHADSLVGVVPQLGGPSSSSDLETEVTIRSLLAIRHCLISASEVRLHLETLQTTSLFLELAVLHLPRALDADTLMSCRQVALATSLRDLSVPLTVARSIFEQIAVWRRHALAWRCQLREFGDSLHQSFVLWEADSVSDADRFSALLVPKRRLIGSVARKHLLQSVDIVSQAESDPEVDEQVAVYVQEFVGLETTQSQVFLDMVSLFAEAALDKESCLAGIFGVDKVAEGRLRVLQALCRRQSLRSVLADERVLLSWDQLLSMASQVARGLVSYHMVAVAAAETQVDVSRLVDVQQPDGWKLTAMPDGLTSAVRAVCSRHPRTMVHGRVSAEAFQVDTNLQLRLDFAFPHPLAGKFDVAMLREVSELDDSQESGINGQWKHYEIPDSAKFVLPVDATVFMAPECFFESAKSRKRLQLTPRTDVYSVGMLLWVLVARAVAGRYVEPFPVNFDGVVSEGTFSKIAHGSLRPTDILGAPLPILALIKRCLRRQPVQRPTMRAVQRDLDAMLRAFVLQRREWLGNNENLPNSGDA